MDKKQVILLEFNEINADLISRFIAQGHLPHFKKLYGESTIYRTNAYTENINTLEPWVQWVTVHSGLSHESHGVKKLGEGGSVSSKLIGEVLSNAGISVGIFSSMNTNYKQLKGYFIPDPWDRSGVAYPKKLQVFYSFVQGMVQEHSQNKIGSIGQIASFVWFMLKNGLSIYTLSKGLRQIISEFNDATSWRRASVLDHIQYDVFRSLTRKHKAQFSTFFVNSVAHYQHYFWRNMEPDVFDRPPSTSDSKSLATAILSGYKSLDDLICRFMTDFPDATLILCSALTQEPWIEADKVTYRPKSFDKFLAFSGIDKNEVEVKPVMAEQFYLDCVSSDVADSVEKALAGLKLDDRPAMLIRREGNSIFSGCIYNSSNIDGLKLVNAVTGESILFDNYFVLVSSVRSGKHNPAGMLWVQNHKHRVEDVEISLTSIAPSILDLFSVSVPDNMDGSRLDFS